MKTNYFRKEERLCNKRHINALYQNGSSFFLYPFKVVFLPCEEIAVPVQVLISVPKRRFKRAVDRNLLKRRIRESYRLRKSSFISTISGSPLLLSFQYIGNKIEEYGTICKKMDAVFIKLRDEYAKVHLE